MAILAIRGRNAKIMPRNLPNNAHYFRGYDGIILALFSVIGPISGSISLPKIMLNTIGNVSEFYHASRPKFWWNLYQMFSPNNLATQYGTCRMLLKMYTPRQKFSETVRSWSMSRLLLCRFSASCWYLSTGKIMSKIMPYVWMGTFPPKKLRKRIQPYVLPERA